VVIERSSSHLVRDTRAVMVDMLAFFVERFLGVLELAEIKHFKSQLTYLDG
jgi:hypothetical protein